MIHQHREGKIWYAIIADLRNISIGIVLIRGSRIMDNHTPIQRHNRRGTLLRPMVRVYLRDPNDLREMRTLRVRRREVETTLRTGTLKVVRVISVHSDQVLRQHMIMPMMILTIQPMMVDMMNSLLRIMIKTRRRETPLRMIIMTGMDTKDKKNQKRRSLRRTTSQS